MLTVTLRNRLTAFLITDTIICSVYKTKKCVFIAQKCGKSFLTYSELLLAQGPPLPSVVPPPPPSHEFAVDQLKGLPEQGGADVGSAALLRNKFSFFYLPNWSNDGFSHFRDHPTGEYQRAFLRAQPSQPCLPHCNEEKKGVYFSQFP